MDARFSIPGVGPATSLGQAAPIILAAKAAPLFRLEGAARSGADADAVHDMRVASRRLREAMRLLAPVYPPEVSSQWYRRIRKVTGALGPVRDSDVFIGAFAALLGELGEGGRMAVAFLMGQRMEQRQHELVHLDRELTHLDLRRAKKEFEKLVRLVAEDEAARRPLADFAHAAVAERAAVVFGLQPKALDVANESEQHILRIAYKRLRYAVEVLAPCYGDAFDALHEALTSFQDALGDLHDYHLFIELATAEDVVAAAMRLGIPELGFAEVHGALRARALEAFERFTGLAATHPPSELLPALLLPLAARPQDGPRTEPSAEGVPEVTPEVTPEVAPEPESVEARVVDELAADFPFVSDDGDLVMPSDDRALGPWADLPDVVVIPETTDETGAET
jgi:CHAD domain-containing protein